MDAFKTAGQAPLAGKQQLSGFSEEHVAMSTEPTELNTRPSDTADAKEVGPADIDEAKSVAGRRRFLHWFGVSASGVALANTCLLYTSPSPRDATLSRMPSSA